MEDKKTSSDNSMPILNGTINSESCAVDSEDEKKLSEADVLLEMLKDLRLFQGENNEPDVECHVLCNIL